MNQLNIALLQITAGNTIEETIEKGVQYCRQAKDAGADIALFPEMYNTGYDIPQDLVLLREKALSVEGEFVQTFKKLAQELDMAIGITILEEYDPAPRNSICLFDRRGELLYTYAKVHTCDFGEERILEPGEDFFVADLNTVKGTIKVGSMICYDRELPESARILMLKGAELLLVPNACPMEINRLSQLRGRAYENMMAIATCNYPSEQPDCNGHSTVFDGVAYVPELDELRDTCILEAGEEEGLYLAQLDLDLLRSYREKEVHGNAFRRPNKYGILVQEKKETPFVRVDYRYHSC